MEGLRERHAGGAALVRAQAALLFAHYLIAFIDTTTLDVVVRAPAKAVLDMIAMFGILLIALVVTGRALLDHRDAPGVGPVALAAFRFALVVCTVLAIYYRPRSVDTWILAVLGATCVDQDERRLLRAGFDLGAAIVAVMFLLSMLDLVENNRGTGFGFIYRTHYACHLLCLALTGCLLRDGKLSWRGELGLVALLILNALFIGGKTLTVCLLLLLPATFLRHYRHAGGTPFQDRRRYGAVIPAVFKLLYLPVVLLDRALPRRVDRRRFRALAWSFVFCAALIILLSAAYRPLEPALRRVPGLTTVKARLKLGGIGLEQYPVRLLGNAVAQWGLSRTEGNVDLYYAIDSGYIKLLLEYGLLPFAAILGLMTWTQLRLYRARRYYAMFLLAIFAIDGLMEYWIISLGYNLFILLASCRLQTPPGWEACEGERRVRPGAAPGVRVLRGAALAACAALACLWCATAYPVSTWPGWTPTANATLVVPGRFIDGLSTEGTRTARLEAALRYLDDHANARCILSGSGAEASEMAAWLAGRGIDPERLRVDEGVTDLPGMLESAHDRIAAEGLPPRLTVCTFKMQQARVARVARDGHIPVNALPVDMPWLTYLPNYFAEQWKILR